MRIFVYEFVTAGGFLDSALGEIPSSLLAEGSAMRNALAADFAALPGCQVSLLEDDRLPERRLEGVDHCRVESLETHDRAFAACASAADWSVVVAPEFDGHLERLARRVVDVGGRLLGPSPEVIALAADKHRLAEHLRAHGVPAPRGIQVDCSEPLPADFRYPAVLKPIDGCGSLGVQRVDCAGAPVDRELDIASRRRLEEFCEGVPVSVALLCGPAGTCPLPPCRQALSTDGRFTYLGGSLPLDDAADQAPAKQLALRAIKTLGEVTGYLGVDLVLGRDAAPGGDVVIEINPRLTTSYVGLRAASRVNLAQAMIDAACGRAPILSFDDRSIRFNAAGKAWNDTFAESWK